MRDLNWIIFHYLNKGIKNRKTVKAISVTMTTNWVCSQYVQQSICLVMNLWISNCIYAPKLLTGLSRKEPWSFALLLFVNGQKKYCTNIATSLNSTLFYPPLLTVMLLISLASSFECIRLRGKLHPEHILFCFCCFLLCFLEVLKMIILSALV